MKEQLTFSRRDFLKAAGITILAGALSSCDFLEQKGLNIPCQDSDKLESCTFYVWHEDVTRSNGELKVTLGEFTTADITKVLAKIAESNGITLTEQQLYSSAYSYEGRVEDKNNNVFTNPGAVITLPVTDGKVILSKIDGLGNPDRPSDLSGYPSVPLTDAIKIIADSSRVDTEKQTIITDQRQKNAEETVALESICSSVFVATLLGGLILSLHSGGKEKKNNSKQTNDVQPSNPNVVTPEEKTKLKKEGNWIQQKEDGQLNAKAGLLPTGRSARRALLEKQKRINKDWEKIHEIGRMLGKE